MTALEPQLDHVSQGVESFSVVAGGYQRSIARRDGTTSTSEVAAETLGGDDDLDRAHDFAWLSSESRPAATDAMDLIGVADLFAGCGGLSLGVEEACRALNLRMVPMLAADIDTEALGVYANNFPGTCLVDSPLEDVLQPFGSGALTHDEQFLMEAVDGVRLLIAGPPCQGHSDLNNHTRRVDPKNELYGTVARVCEFVRPALVIIENVPGVTRDRSQIAQRTWAQLRDLGYHLDSGVVDASAVGVAQQRRRSITLCSLDRRPSVAGAQREVGAVPRPLSWAIGNVRVCESHAPFDTPPLPSAENSRRMDFLFDNELYDLPDAERPDCHRLKPHSYVSMYGRLRPQVPSPTITTGFGSMGRGRFVHPFERRTITPHEAARIQGFPDFFSFMPANRTLLHKIIGNAVPPKLGYALGLHLLR